MLSDCDWVLFRKTTWWPTEMKCPDPLVPKFQNVLIPFEFEAQEMQCGDIERNKVVAALPTGLGKNLIFQFFDIAAEIKSRISCLTFTEHYPWPDFRGQKHGSFSCINCWFNVGGVEVGSQASWMYSMLLHAGTRGIVHKVPSENNWTNLFQKTIISWTYTFGDWASSCCLKAILLFFVSACSCFLAIIFSFFFWANRASIDIPKKLQQK